MCEVGEGGFSNDDWNVYENNHRVRLNVISNGMPNHCFDSPEYASTPQWIDFSVYWQPPKPYLSNYS